MKIRTVKARITLIAILFAMFFVFAGNANLTYATDGLNVTQHSKQDIVNQLKNSGVSVSDEHTFKTQPIFNTQQGELSDQAEQSALKMLNNIRYIAGVNNNVTLDSNYGTKAQAAAFVLASVGKDLSHNPKSDYTKPSGMPDSIWTLGDEGAGSSNISAGRGTLNATVLGWMDDGSSSNVPMVGHRRWSINPKMGKVGFGAAYNSNSYYGTYYAEYSFDDSGSGTQTNVAWPARYMPVEYFGKDIPWSLSTGSNINNPSGLVVTLTRKSTSPSGSGSWTFRGSESYTAANSGKYFNVNNDNYGQKGCIIFRPDNVSYKAGDIFDVTIKGSGLDIAYTVEFFSGYPVETAVFEEEVFYTSPYYWNNYLSLKTTPADANDFEVQWTSSDESIATISDGEVTPIRPGTTTVTATIPGKYTESGNPISASCTVIVPKSITDSSISIVVKNPEFTGQVAKPIVTITDTSNNYVLEENKDYELRSDDEIIYPSDGYTTVWIYGKGAYSGGTSIPVRNYKVNKKTITSDMITLNETDFTYNGQTQKPSEIVVKNGNLTLTEGVDYTVTNNGGTNAGNYGVTVKATTGTNANYTSSATASFTINPKALTQSMLVPGADLTYTGDTQTPNYSLKDNGVELVKNTDYTLEVDSAINRGTYTYRTTGKGNYSGVLEGLFTISPATITANDIELAQSSFEYDGNKKEPSVTVRVNNKTLTETADYDLTIENAVDRGSYTVTVTGKGAVDNTANYIGEGNKTFVINAKPLTEDMVALSKDSFVYNTEEQKPGVEVKHGNKDLSEGTDFNLSNSGGTNAGEYNVIVSAVTNGNYSGSITKTYSITQKSVSEDMLFLSTDSFIYNGDTQSPDITVKDGTKDLNDADYELSNTGGKNVGEYSVTLVGKGNYTGSASAMFSITPLSINDTAITVGGLADAEYTGSEIVPSAVLSYSDTLLKKGTDFTLACTDNVNVGSGKLTIEGIGNFTDNRTETFNIYAKNIDAADVVVEDIPDQVFTGKILKPIPVIRYNGSILPEDEYTLYYEDNDAEGTGKVNIIGDGNFTGTRVVTFNIISQERADLLEIIATLQQDLQNETDADFKTAIQAALDTANEIAADEGATKAQLASALETAQNARSAAQATLQEKKDKAEAEEEAKKRAEEEAAKKKAEEAAARASQKGSDGTSLGKGASAENAEKAIMSSTSDEGPKGSKFSGIELKSTKQTKTNITLSWKKPAKTVKLVIYGNACGKKNKMLKLGESTGKSLKVTKINGKALKKGTYYKFMVVALDSKNNVVSTSKVIHVATKGNKKIANPTKVTAKAPKTLKKSKTHKLAAKQVGKNVKKHRAIVYESTNTKIATVSKTGVIKAVGKGTCYVYAYAQNGVFKKVKVVVK